MASGNECLELTEAGTWESFPAFAERYVAQIGARVIRRIKGPDAHLWEIKYEGVVLNFVYDDFPNGVAVEPKTKEGQHAINKLYDLAVLESDPNGL